LELRFHNAAAQVVEVEKTIAGLQSSAEPNILAKPQPGWCEGA
jgi:hypothetical protein